MHRIRLLAAAAFLFGLMGVVAVRPGSVAALSCSPCPATATADVNLLAEPSPSSPVLSVIPAGAALEWDNLQGTVDGFVAVSYDGVDGWADDENLLLFPLSATTTAELNLYADPNPESEIRAVMPSGTWVQVLGGPENGFFSVRFEEEQIAGWASADSIALDERPDDGDVDTLPTTGVGTTAGTQASTSLLGIAVLGMFMSGAVVLYLRARGTR